MIPNSLKTPILKYICESQKFDLPPVLMSKGQYTTPTYVNMHRRRLILLGIIFYDTKQPNNNHFFYLKHNYNKFHKLFPKIYSTTSVNVKGVVFYPNFVNMHRMRLIFLGLIFYDTKEPSNTNFGANIESKKFDRLLVLMSKGQYTTHPCSYAY